MQAKAINIMVAVISIMSLGCVATQSDVSSVYARQTRLEAKVERLSNEVKTID